MFRLTICWVVLILENNDIIQREKMKLVDAVYARVVELAKSRNLSMNALSNLSGVPRTTIITMTNSSTVKLSTVYGICDGLNITLGQFFDSPLFDNENISD